MMKKIAFTIAATAALAACGRAEADPQPDPRQVEQLVASLNASAAAPPPEVQEKLVKADRIVTAIDRSEPDRLAGAAERLLAN